MAPSISIVRVATVHASSLRWLYGTGPPDCLKKSLFDNFDIFSARAVLILILKLFFHLLYVILFCFVTSVCFLLERDLVFC